MGITILIMEEFCIYSINKRNFYIFIYLSIYTCLNINTNFSTQQSIILHYITKKHST